MIDKAVGIARTPPTDSTDSQRVEGAGPSPAQDVPIDVSFSNFMAMPFAERFEAVASHTAQVDSENFLEGAGPSPAPDVSAAEAAQAVEVGMATDGHVLSFGFDHPDFGLGFDEAQDSEQDFVMEDLFGQAATPETAADVTVPSSIPKRRIRGKTPAHLTGFSAEILVTKVERKRLAEIENLKKLKVRRLDAATTTIAQRAFALQPEMQIGSEVESEQDEFNPAATSSNDVATMPAVVRDDRAPHDSHDIKRMATHAIVYCNTCGKWAGQNNHSQLSQECEPILRGYKHALRLLQHDIVPGRGAQLPASAKRKPGRKRL